MRYAQKDALCRASITDPENGSSAVHEKKYFLLASFRNLCIRSSHANLQGVHPPFCKFFRTPFTQKAENNFSRSFSQLQTNKSKYAHFFHSGSGGKSYLCAVRKRRCGKVNSTLPFGRPFSTASRVGQEKRLPPPYLLLHGTPPDIL